MKALISDDFALLGNPTTIIILKSDAARSAFNQSSALRMTCFHTRQQGHIIIVVSITIIIMTAGMWQQAAQLPCVPLSLSTHVCISRQQVGLATLKAIGHAARQTLPEQARSHIYLDAAEVPCEMRLSGCLVTQTSSAAASSPHLLNACG